MRRLDLGDGSAEGGGACCCCLCLNPGDVCELSFADDEFGAGVVAEVGRMQVGKWAAESLTGKVVAASVQ